MNTHTNHLPPATFSRMLLIIALTICPCVAVQSAHAQDIATATLTDNGSSLVTLTNSNEVFTLTLSVNTDFPSGGITYFLKSTNGNGLFQIVNRDYSSSPYTDPTTTNATAFAGTAGVLNPANKFDLGLTYNGTDVPAGLYAISVLTIDTLNAPPGTYTIFTDRGIVVDTTGGNFTEQAFTAMATIVVVPEPATVTLMMIGGGLLLAAVWQKRRARAQTPVEFTS